ncbi:4-galactosyl-N-acetylglucosaminide 3-alpha-L-fucosyltransferase FUT6-like [Watersipora subatra]|uniref:4-galactosyl-N-acetylglucosaminide 3-alpha-L-fucosyltransferase FUT6-like n=1 Tax=Watersipora subatra TaxID=2589382 RepID=UPI00355B7A97
MLARGILLAVILGTALLTININVFRLTRNALKFSNEPLQHQNVWKLEGIHSLSKSETKKPSKTILAYTTIYNNTFNIQNYIRTEQERRLFPDPLLNCEYPCSWSTDLRDYNRSDAVLFHVYNTRVKQDFVITDLPSRRSADQKWIIMFREPPSFFYPEQLKELNNKFNISMTYQRTSDVVIPYGRCWRSKGFNPQHQKQNYITGRNRMVSWLVSNCRTSSRREEYVRKLQKHISIDIYGACSNNTDPNNGNKFIIKYAAKYKFYLAFENSDCFDYVTEKFWNSLQLGMIPVVRGNRAAYEKLAPPNSYIHAGLFPSPQRLASYLIKVAADRKLFYSYHKWRASYEFDATLFTANRKWMCDLCERVHISPRKTLDVYEHFSEVVKCFTYLDHKGRNRTGENTEDLYHAKVA